LGPTPTPTPKYMYFYKNYFKIKDNFIFIDFYFNLLKK